jgi:hypothetical protein
MVEQDAKDRAKRPAYIKRLFIDMKPPSRNMER